MSVRISERNIDTNENTTFPSKLINTVSNRVFRTLSIINRKMTFSTNWRSTLIRVSFGMKTVLDL